MFSARQERGIKCLKWELRAETQCEAVFLGGIRTDTQSGGQAVETRASSILLCLTTRLERTVYCGPRLPEMLLTCNNVYKHLLWLLGAWMSPHPSVGRGTVGTKQTWWPGRSQDHGESQHLLAEPGPGVKAKLLRAAPLISCGHCWSPGFLLWGKDFWNWTLPSRICNGGTWSIFCGHKWAY